MKAFLTTIALLSTPAFLFAEQQMTVEQYKSVKQQLKADSIKERRSMITHKELVDGKLVERTTSQVNKKKSSPSPLGSTKIFCKYDLLIMPNKGVNAQQIGSRLEQRYQLQYIRTLANGMMLFKNTSKIDTHSIIEKIIESENELNTVVADAPFDMGVQ